MVLPVFVLSLLLSFLDQAAPAAAPAPAPETAAQIACANFTLAPQYYPYLNTSFLGKARSIQVDTVDFSYYQFGPLNVSSADAGRSLILINGVGGTKSDWSPCLLRPLAAGRQVTIFDNRGVGFSNDSYTGNYTLDDYASSTVGLIEALRLETPDVIGVSLGSLIAQAVAVNYRWAVTHVILSDTALMGAGLLTISDPPDPDSVFVAAQGTSGDLPSRKYPYYLPAGLAGLCTDDNLTSYMPIDKPTAAQLAHQATIENDITTPGAGGDEVYYGLPNITNPVLIIAGAQDSILPIAYDIEAAQIIPDASLIVYSDAGHASLTQHCLYSVPIVTNWLDDHA